MTHSSLSKKQIKGSKVFKQVPSIFLALTAFVLGCLTGMHVESPVVLTEIVPSKVVTTLRPGILLPQKPLPIERPGYTLEYDGRTRNAHWVYECLTADSLKGKIERINYAFQEDPKIPRMLQNTLEDFKGSGFDRGHLAPAADHKGSADAMRDTFYLSNMSPQDPQFNRGYWVKLEKYVRDLTKNCKLVHVITGPLFLPNLEEHGKKFVKYQVIGRNNVAVPTHFFKVIMRETATGHVNTEAYLLPNRQIAKETPLSQFQTTVQDIEKVSGLLFQK